jgi:chemosensory pili system protein ChpA (sensor histidine kinase/response regulator)
VQAKPVPASGLPTDARRAVAASTASAAALNRPLVLVADRQPASPSARERQLARAGFRVVVARTGFEAIVKASCQMPDLILLDSSIGGEEADETGRLLTTCPVTAHIPIVAVTGGRRVPARVLADVRRQKA